MTRHAARECRKSQMLRAVSEALRPVPPLIVLPPARRPREPYAKPKRAAREKFEG